MLQRLPTASSQGSVRPMRHPQLVCCGLRSPVSRRPTISKPRPWCHQRATRDSCRTRCTSEDDGSVTKNSEDDGSTVTKDSRFIPFPSIEQFRQLIATVNYQCEKFGEPLPTLTFRGTVKLHGMHADIVKFADGTYSYQSRNNILGPARKDVQGFYHYMNTPENAPAVQALFEQVAKIHGPWTQSIMLAGECCGGAIQRGVATAKLDKMFVIFAIKIDGAWVNDLAAYKDVHANGNRIFNILQFPTYEVTVDFNNPTEVQQMLEDLTEKVDAECPVAKYFGISGTGEGIVWTTTDGRHYKFKTKGETHMKIEKAGQARKVRVGVAPEVMAGVQEFVEKVLTPGRLEQGIQYLEEQGLDTTALNNITTFITWLANDVIKEETDTMEASDLDPKLVRKEVGSRGVAWYKARAKAAEAKVDSGAEAKSESGADTKSE